MSERGKSTMNNVKLEEKSAFLGTYSIPSATLYVLATSLNGSKLRINTKHLYYWVRDGLASGYLKGIRNHRLFINYKDLISLRAITAMRAKGMKHKEIMLTDMFMRERYKCDYPFASVTFWTVPPRDVFVKEDGVLLSATRDFQSAMEFVEEYLQPSHNMTFDMFGVSATWRPHNNVLLDPQIQYGEPCIEGTRVPTQVIWSFNKAGDSIDTLSYFYGIQRSKIEDAIAWENHIQKIGYPQNR